MLIRPPLVLDTDVISRLAWVKRLDILEKLYSKQMKVLPEVIYEISRVPHLKVALERSIKDSHIEITALKPLGKDGQEFAQLRGTGKYGYGEAAVMAYVRYNSGTVSSNNIGDVLKYCQKNNIALLSIRPIFVDAINKKVLTLADAENVWNEMITKKAKLPCKTVKEAIEYYSTGPGAKLTYQKF